MEKGLYKKARKQRLTLLKNLKNNKSNKEDVFFKAFLLQYENYFAFDNLKDKTAEIELQNLIETLEQTYLIHRLIIVIEQKVRNDL